MVLADFIFAVTLNNTKHINTFLRKRITGPMNFPKSFQKVPVIFLRRTEMNNFGPRL